VHRVPLVGELAVDGAQPLQLGVAAADLDEGPDQEDGEGDEGQADDGAEGGAAGGILRQ
jgi:hypothetical protein